MKLFFVICFGFLLLNCFSIPPSQTSEVRDSSENLLSQSQTYCWGNGGAVQFGVSPSPSWNGYNFNTIKVGRIHFCAIEGLVNETSGLGYCWGNSLDGEVGNGQKGDYVDNPSLLMLQAERDALAAGNQNYPSTTWVEIGAGQDFSCGKTSTGELYCWGGNYWGELGNGQRYTSDGYPDAVLTSDPTNPSIQYPEFHNLSLGAFHACVIAKTDSHIWCWGKGGDGQLGNNSTNASIPYPIEIYSADLPIKSFLSVSCGVAHTCAISSDFQVYCWGNNRYGQIGIEGVPGTTTPQRISKLYYDFKTPVQLSSSERHTCLLTSDGSVYCWGDAGYGKLGNNQTSGTFYTPQQVVSTVPSKRDSKDDHSHGTIASRGRSYSPKDNTLHFVSIETGQSFSCAQALDGFLYCWGANGQGQLGNGVVETNPSIGYATPQKVSPIAIPAGQQPFYLSSGDYSSCLIAGDKSVVTIPDPSTSTTLSATSGTTAYGTTTSSSTTTSSTGSTSSTSSTTQTPQGSSSSHLSSFGSLLIICFVVLYF